MQSHPSVATQLHWQVKHEHYWEENDAQENRDDYNSDVFALRPVFLRVSLYSIIHLSGATSSHEPKMFVFISGTGPTSPTELILAEAASHMIAAFILLYSCAAHRAN